MAEIVIQKVAGNTVILSSDHKLAQNEQKKMWENPTGQDCILAIYPGFDATYFFVELAWYMKNASDEQIKEAQEMFCEHEGYEPFTVIYADGEIKNH
jgi:hypothetical protein